VTNEAASTISYTYDALNRLSRAKTTASGGAITDDRLYAYDAVGNRMSQTINGVTTSYTYNSANELLTSGGLTYTYDGNGSLTARSDGLALAYDASNFTSSITPPGGATLNMSYSGLDQTQRAQAGGVSFVYDLIGLSRRTDASGAVYELRCPCGQLISERSASGTDYVLYDVLGSTIGLTDGSGAVAATWKYDSWGTVLAKTGTADTSTLFQGALLDSATGLYKIGARYYDPGVARWTQRDAVTGTPSDPETYNAYVFVGNNPVNATDPSGYFWLALLAVVLVLVRILAYVCLAYAFVVFFRWADWAVGDWVCINWGVRELFGWRWVFILQFIWVPAGRRL
jgi:RHS repeat-associated protein